MSVFEARRPIAWISAVVDQLACESGLEQTADLEDLVIIAYLGLLDGTDPLELRRDRLLARCRSQIVTWAWEQGRHDEAITGPRRPVSLEQRRLSAPCPVLLQESRAS